MRCKVGDCCVVIDSSCPPNYGRMVEILAPSRLHPSAWICESLAPDLLAGYPLERYKKDAPGELLYLRRVSFLDKQLQPLWTTTSPQEIAHEAH